MRKLSSHPAVLEALVCSFVVVFLPQSFLPGTVLHDEDVPLFIALGSACLEWCLVFPALLLGLVGIRSARAWLRILSSVLLGLGVWLYLLSWGLFYGVEFFINLASLRMGGASFTLLLKHFLEFSPGVFAVACVLGPVLGALAHYWGGRASAFGAAAAHRWSFVPLVVMVLTAGAGFGAAKLSQRVVTDRKTASVWLFPEYHALVLRNRTGPMLHLALDSFAPLDEGHWVLRSAPYPIESAPRSSGAAYNAAIPASARDFNVIVLLVESLRRDVLVSLGGKRSVMPHLDALAARSQVFSRAYAQATHSDYADVTALSSQFPIRYRVHTEYFPSPPYPRELLHDVLKPRGYRTAIISSQNEHWANMYDFLKTPHLDYFFHSEDNAAAYTPEGDAGFMGWAESWKRSGKLDDQVTISEVIRWIGESKKPFSLYTNLQNSHFPYRFPEGMPFQPSEVDFPLTFARYPKDKKHIVQNRYHNALHYIDQQIGRLVQHLEKSGQLERTLLLVSGDTGQAFYEHGFASHGQPAFEELGGIPLVIYVPGAKPAKYDILTSQVDYLPTLIALLGMPPHPGHQGRSVFEMVKEKGAPLALDEGGAPRVVFTGRQLPGVQEIVVVRDQYKLFLLGDDSTLLFDMNEDPGERHNLSDKLPRVRDALVHMALSYRKAQLDYYASDERMAREYQPRLRLPERLE